MACTFALNVCVCQISMSLRFLCKLILNLLLSQICASVDVRAISGLNPLCHHVDKHSVVSTFLFFCLCFFKLHFFFLSSRLSK